MRERRKNRGASGAESDPETSASKMCFKNRLGKLLQKVLPTVVSTFFMKICFRKSDSKTTIFASKFMLREGDRKSKVLGIEAGD